MIPALVVVDMQNDFLAKGRYYDRRNLGEDATRLEEGKIGNSTLGGKDRWALYRAR